MYYISTIRHYHVSQKSSKTSAKFETVVPFMLQTFDTIEGLTKGQERLDIERLSDNTMFEQRSSTTRMLYI